MNPAISVLDVKKRISELIDSVNAVENEWPTVQKIAVQLAILEPRIHALDGFSIEEIAEYDLQKTLHNLREVLSSTSQFLTVTSGLVKSNLANANDLIATVTSMAKKLEQLTNEVGSLLDELNGARVKSISELIATFRRKQVWPTGARLVHWLKQVATQLQALHSRNELHGHLSPDTIAVYNQEKVELLASTVDPNDCERTPINIQNLYRSYERASGATSDGRDDMWAVGCVLAELLTGDRLAGIFAGSFNHPTDDQDRARRRLLVNAAIAVDPRLGLEILPHLLQPLAATRYTAEQLLEALDRLDLSGELVLTKEDIGAAIDTTLAVGIVLVLFTVVTCLSDLDVGIFALLVALPAAPVLLYTLVPTQLLQVCREAHLFRPVLPYLLAARQFMWDMTAFGTVVTVFYYVTAIVTAGTAVTDSVGKVGLRATLCSSDEEYRQSMNIKEDSIFAVLVFKCLLSLDTWRALCDRETPTVSRPILSVAFFVAYAVCVATFNVSAGLLLVLGTLPADVLRLALIRSTRKMWGLPWQLLPLLVGGVLLLPLYAMPGCELDAYVAVHVYIMLEVYFAVRAT